MHWCRYRDVRQYSDILYDTCTTNCLADMVKGLVDKYPDCLQCMWTRVGVLVKGHRGEA